MIRRNFLSLMSEFNSLDEAVRLIEILHRCEEGIEPSYRASYLLRNSPVALPAYARLCYRQGNVSYAARLARKHFEQTRTEEALFERLFYCYAKSCRTMEQNVSMSTRRRMVALRNTCISRFLQIENLPHVSAFLLELYLRGEIKRISRKQFFKGMNAFFSGFYAEAPFPAISAFAPLRPHPDEFPVPKHKELLSLAVILHEFHETNWIKLSESELKTVSELLRTSDNAPPYMTALPSRINHPAELITSPTETKRIRCYRLLCLKTFHGGG